MEILSTESMEKLRSECKENPKLVTKNLDELKEEFNLSLIPFSNKTIQLYPLQLPDGYSQETNKDLENCKIILESLGNLSAAEATDERLWTTLCFGNYSKYSKARWPLERAKNSDYVQNHWFARSSRNRMRDNAIARLWWMGHISQKVSISDHEAVLKTLFFNSDYRSNLLERNSSANSINVVDCILEISEEAFERNVEFNRLKFRNFMKSVDLIGKRTFLPSLNKAELKKILKPLYNEAYKKTVIKKSKSNGILGRFGIK